MTLNITKSLSFHSQKSFNVLNPQNQKHLKKRFSPLVMTWIFQQERGEKEKMPARFAFRVPQSRGRLYKARGSAAAPKGCPFF